MSVRARRATVAVAIAVALLVLASSANAGASWPTASNGAPVQLFASGLKVPTSFAFGDGAVFEGDGGSEDQTPVPGGGVYLLSDGGAALLPGSPEFVAGLVWHDGTLYVSGGTMSGSQPVWQILAWSGWNGTTFATQQVIYTAPEPFDGFNGIAVGPHGRLYVGVDVGLTDGNDHGPAATSPHLYDVLSLSPSGTDLKVFATGMRQPWQLVFPAGSRFPFVSDLGPDRDSIDPPDFVLRVHAGDDYGFPKCGRNAERSCRGFAKPFKRFAPHTDIMGLAIVGDRLYMSSFLGPGAGDEGGEVLSMPLSGGVARPFMTGFTAPVIGLGAHDGSLYVGQLGGDVFTVSA